MYSVADVGGRRGLSAVSGLGRSVSGVGRGLCLGCGRSVSGLSLIHI